MKLSVTTFLIPVLKEGGRGVLREKDMKVDMRKERKKELQMNCCLSSCSPLYSPQPLFSSPPSREIAVIAEPTFVRWEMKGNENAAK